MMKIRWEPRLGELGVANDMNVSNYKDALLKKRIELEETAGLKPLTDSMEHNNGRQGDMADQASGNNEVHIQLRLKQTDAKILQAIDEALMRIEKGNFGICKDCGEPIAEARLNAIPWTRVVHHLQGKAEGVSAPALADLIRDCYLERVALLMRHEDVASHVTDYDINNAYQYIIAREETHLSWLQHALLDLGAPLPQDPPRGAAPTVKGDGWKSLAADDARANAAVRREMARPHRRR